MNLPVLGPKDHTPMQSPIAPDGWVWQCQACGKRTHNRFGLDGGWDEACMLNAVLIREEGNPDV